MENTALLLRPDRRRRYLVSDTIFVVDSDVFLAGRDGA
jgi:hypothetical protein